MVSNDTVQRRHERCAERPHYTILSEEIELDDEMDELRKKSRAGSDLPSRQSPAQNRES
jgi:hypothetical protein